MNEPMVLYQAARILQAADGSPREVLARLVRILPAAWQYPAITEARIQILDWVVATPQFAETPWMQRAVIADAGGAEGLIEIAYSEERPASDDGPFLKAEGELIGALTEMLGAYLHRVIADEGLLESQSRIERYQSQLRQLASQLTRVEARERRAIAADLHDHIGQALAFIRMNVAQLQANAAFCGFEEQIAETLALLNQTIRYTRDLTTQISPPVLYELGLSAALLWLRDSTQAKHKIIVRVDAPTEHRRLADEISATIFKSVQELVTNALKHAGAQSILIRLVVSDSTLTVDVADDGCGFDEDALHSAASLGDHFGLFSIREQIRHLGGETTIASSPGRGTTVTLVLPC